MPHGERSAHNLCGLIIVVPLTDILLGDFGRKFLSSNRVSRELFFQAGGDKVGVSGEKVRSFAVVLLEAPACGMSLLLRLG